MIDLITQEAHFKDHKATFTDCGNIKILDFKKPGTSEYRIRFIFEEDYYRCHISEVRAANKQKGKEWIITVMTLNSYQNSKLATQ